MKHLPIILLSIFGIIVFVYSGLTTNWWEEARIRFHWREFINDCEEEGGKFELCLKKPICWDKKGFSIPTNGYGQEVGIGSIGGHFDIDEDKIAWSLSPIEIDKSCFKKTI